MAKRYVVNLTSGERSTLEKLVNTGRASAKKQIHARILLKADVSAEGPGWSDRQICEALEVSSSCVERVRKRLVEEGLEAALWSCPGFVDTLSFGIIGVPDAQNPSPLQS